MIHIQLDHQGPLQYGGQLTKPRTLEHTAQPASVWSMVLPSASVGLNFFEAAGLLWNLLCSSAQLHSSGKDSQL